MEIYIYNNAGVFWWEIDETLFHAESQITYNEEEDARKSAQEFINAIKEVEIRKEVVTDDRI